MIVVRWIEVAVGLAVVVVALYDVFKTAVLPRPAIGRFSLVRYLNRMLWKAWRLIGTRVERAAVREGWLAAFGPFGVFAMLGFWAASLILGYALVLDGLAPGLRPTPSSFADSLYFSAATFEPLSYGDVVPMDAPTRITTIAESANGLVLVALGITLLFSLYQSFQAREELVVTLDAIAGAPPSGLQLLETAAERRMRAELARTFEEWRRWAASVLESHLAYPILFYFRSSHDNEAWLNSFGAVMDAAALVVSTVEDQSEGAAHLMLTVGNHLVEDFTWYFRLERTAEPYVERTEFDSAIARLEQAGFKCRAPALAWKEFIALRERYAHSLNQLAKWLAILPAQWIGDRSYVPHQRVRPRRSRLRR